MLTFLSAIASLRRPRGGLPIKGTIQFHPGAAAAGARPEVSLVEAARAGDRAAWGDLYVRYARMVHGILLARVPAADADDLTQDVFIRAMKALAQLRDSAAFGGWLASMARNSAHDYHRKAHVAEDPVPDDVAAKGDVRSSVEAAAALQAIRELPEAYRETLTLRLVEGMTGPEIALRTGLTADSVRVNLHRGMKLLKERLEGGSKAP